MFIENKKNLVIYGFNSDLVLLNPDLSFFENTVDPDQLASDEAS